MTPHILRKRSPLAVHRSPISKQWQWNASIDRPINRPNNGLIQRNISPFGQRITVNR